MGLLRAAPEAHQEGTTVVSKLFLSCVQLWAVVPSYIKEVGGWREDYNWFSLPTNTSTAPRNGNQQRILILAEAEPMWKADPRSGRASDRRNQRVELGFACDLSSVSATGKYGWHRPSRIAPRC